MVRNSQNPILFSNDMAAAELVNYNTNAMLIEIEPPGLVQGLTKTDRCQVNTRAFLPYVLFP